MRNLFFGIAALSIITVAAASSCTTETTGSGGGEEGGGTTTNDGGGGTGGTTTTGACTSCLDYVEAALGMMAFDPATMCGYDAGGMPAPASSYGLLLALGECICDPMGGDCGPVCTDTCAGMGTDMEPECSTCQQAEAMSSCSADFNACTADTMGSEG